MARPIFVIRVPIEYAGHNLTKYPKDFLEIKKEISASLEAEYNCIFILDELVNSLVFECFNVSGEEEKALSSFQDRLNILMESALWRIGEMKRIEESKRSDEIKKYADELKKMLPMIVKSNSNATVQTTQPAYPNYSKSVLDRWFKDNFQ